MNQGEFILRAKELRDAAKAAEDRFFAFLYDGEKSDFWQGSGLTYEQFLKNTNLCEPARYSGYRKTRDNHGAKVIEKVGVEAAIAAGYFSDAKDQQEVLSRAARSAEANGMQPSAQTVRGYASDVKSRNNAIRSGGAKSYAVLTEENDQLREENNNLKQQIIAFKSEIKKLKSDKKVSVTLTKGSAKAKAA